MTNWKLIPSIESLYNCFHQRCCPCDILPLVQVQVLVIGGRNPCLSVYRPILIHQCDKSACVSCPPGYGVVQQCRGSTKTVCKACVAGVNFSDTSTPYEICLPVGMCSENYVVDIPATSEHDIQCKCKDGYVENLEGFCEYIPVRLPYKTQSSASPTATSLQSIVTSTQLISPFTTRSDKETETRQTTQSSASMVSPMAEVAVVNVTQPPRKKHPTSRGGSSVSSMIKTPLTNATGPPHTKHPPSHSVSSNPRIIENGMSSTVIGVCVVVVLITMAVVTVACHYYRCCTCRLKWSGKQQDDEEQHVGQQNDSMKFHC